MKAGAKIQDYFGSWKKGNKKYELFPTSSPEQVEIQWGEYGENPTNKIIVPALEGFIRVLAKERGGFYKTGTYVGTTADQYILTALDVEVELLRRKQYKQINRLNNPKPSNPLLDWLGGKDL